jgi:hypothetical protein
LFLLRPPVGRRQLAANTKLLLHPIVRCFTEFCLLDARRPALQRQPHGERPLSHTAAAATATAAAAVPAAESWTAVPAHRALQMLSRYRALVLDSAYRPVEVVNWQRAICMDLLQKADVLEYYEATVSSVSEQFFLPAVMRTRRYRPTSSGASRVALNRRNILLRDKLCCQYWCAAAAATLCAGAAPLGLGKQGDAARPRSLSCLLAGLPTRLVASVLMQRQIERHAVDDRPRDAGVKGRGEHVGEPGDRLRALQLQEG